MTNILYNKKELYNVKKIPTYLGMKFACVGRGPNDLVLLVISWG